MLIDSHCHLNRLDFNSNRVDLNGVLSRAKDSGVGCMLTVATELEETNDLLELTQNHSTIYTSIGVHPLNVKSDQPLSVQEIIDLAHNKAKVVAIGETGLDYFYSSDNRELQQQYFITQMRAAAKLKLPVIVHSRDAKEDTLALIKQHADAESSGVLHCFTGAWDMAKQALDFGFYISISGIVTFRNAVDLQETVKKIPHDRLLIETDSPYLAPVPYRGKPNEPAYVLEVAKAVADLKGVSKESLIEMTGNNFFKLFNKAKVDIDKAQ